MVESYDLQDIAREAAQLILDVVEATRGFPKSETFGLSLKIRRDAIAVAASLASGAGEETAISYLSSLHRSLRHIDNVRDSIKISRERGFLTEAIADGLLFTCDAIKARLKELSAPLAN